jgi:hypothetical protein
MQYAEKLFQKGSVEAMSTSKYDQSGATPAITSTKIFKKGFFKQYGILFGLVPLLFLFVWLAFASPETRTASLVTAGACVLLSLIPFFQVGALKVEPNKLTIETFFEEKQLSAGEIKEIKMQSVRGRYGRVTHFVNIIPVKGKNYPVGKFNDRPEIIYEFLMNWWNNYRNQ